MFKFITYIAVVVVICGLFIINATQANSTFTLPALTAKTNTIVTVGPDTNVQVLATTSDRAYAYFARENGVAAVYCNANGDQYASTTLPAVSFKLSTTSGEVYEMYLEKNPYNGAVRCTASASTTIIVSEYKVRNSY